MTRDLGCRWGDYFLRGVDDFDSFWGQLVSESERNVLFILGHGFDRRMCVCAERILSFGGDGVRDAIVVEYNEAPGSFSHQYGELRQENGRRLQGLFDSRGAVETRRIDMVSCDGRRMGARSIVDAFSSVEDFEGYTDVVVDVSALPRGLYFPLLSKLLAVFDSDLWRTTKPNLHAAIAHSHSLDQRIIDDGVEENASFLHGFAAASFEREATRDVPRIWIPLLGRQQEIQLERIYELVNPDEICPLLPSPSRNPREGDDLLLEYWELLFDRLRVEPQNIIYASESNPFEVYRQLMRSVVRYRQALEPLGGCKVVLSALSSKLLSLGALLCGYELAQWRSPEERISVGVAHVDAQGYRIDGDPAQEEPVELYNLWLCGECYEKSGT